MHLESQVRRNVQDSTTYLIRTSVFPHAYNPPFTQSAGAMYVFHPDAFDGPDVVSANTALTEILRVSLGCPDSREAPAHLIHATGRTPVAG